jgi:hypothetical protein
MALFNELLVGRYNRLAQKLLSMKGQASLRQLTSDLQFVLPLMHGVENRYLEGWDLFGVAATTAAIAAQTSAAKIRNPAGSNVIAVVEKVMFIEGGTQQTVFLQLAADTVDYAGAITGQRLDARGRANSTLLFSTNATGTGTTTIEEAGMPINTSYDFIMTANQELTVLPGNSCQLIAGSVNANFGVTFRWRERFLEDSERA